MTCGNIFLIGKTGHGKSSTGNSLLEREAFVVSDSGDSVTSAVQVGQVNRNGTSLRVVDGPGLGDTRMDTTTAIRNTTRDLETGLQHCPDGVHAFLLVLKYGNRYTGEERRTVDDLKVMLGPNIVRDFCVLVFTHGEDFDLKNKTTGTSFEDWCRQQTGDLATLIAECGNRCVLFYNLDIDKMAAPMADLLHHVDTIRQQRGSYSMAMFQAMKFQHEQMLIRADAPAIQQKYQSETQQLRQQLQDIQSSSSSFDDKLSRLASLTASVRQCKERASTEEKGTDILRAQIQNLTSMEADVMCAEGSVRNDKIAEQNRQEEESLRLERERVERERAEATAARRRRNSGPDCRIS